MRAPAIFISGAACLISLCTAGGAASDSRSYFGIDNGRFRPGFEYTVPENTAFGGPVNFSLSVGNRYEFGAAFLGLEAGANLPLANDSVQNNSACQSRFPQTLFACDQPARLSLRSLVGSDLLNSDYQFYGSLGYSVAVRDASYSNSDEEITGILGGFAVGAGVQHQTTGGGIFRAEVVKERADDANARPTNLAEPTLEDLSVTLSYIMNF